MFWELSIYYRDWDRVSAQEVLASIMKPRLTAGKSWSDKLFTYSEIIGTWNRLRILVLLPILTTESIVLKQDPQDPEEWINKS